MASIHHYVDAVAVEALKLVGIFKSRFIVARSQGAYDNGLPEFLDQHAT